MTLTEQLPHLSTDDLRKFVEYRQDKIIAGNAIVRDYELYIQAQWELAQRLERGILTLPERHEGDRRYA